MKFFAQVVVPIVVAVVAGYAQVKTAQASRSDPASVRCSQCGSESRLGPPFLEQMGWRYCERFVILCGGCAPSDESPRIAIP